MRVFSGYTRVPENEVRISKIRVFSGYIRVPENKLRISESQSSGFQNQERFGKSWKHVSHGRRYTVREKGKKKGGGGFWLLEDSEFGKSSRSEFPASFRKRHRRSMSTISIID